MLNQAATQGKKNGRKSERGETDHPLPAMLGLSAFGLLMGVRDVLDIGRRAACSSQSQRQALRLCVRDKQSRRLTMPGYDALNDLLGAIDPQACARALRAF